MQNILKLVLVLSNTNELKTKRLNTPETKSYVKPLMSFLFPSIEPT